MAEAVTLQGADRSYVLDISCTNAMCRLEDATGVTFLTVLARLARPHPPRRLLEQFVLAALVDPPPDQEVATILDDIGGGDVIRAAVRAAARQRRRARHG
jgi:hypothetical protein